MDPNECLKKILELARAIAREHDGVQKEGMPFDRDEELAFHVESLDAWITCGGFLPARWSHK